MGFYESFTASEITSILDDFTGDSAPSPLRIQNPDASVSIKNCFSKR